MNTTNRAPDGKARNPRYEPSQSETTAIAKFFQQANYAVPRIKVQDGSPQQFAPDHPVEVVGQLSLMNALGTADLDFYHGLLRQLARASSRDDQINELDFNFMLSIIKGAKPRDQLETLLLAQIAAVQATVIDQAYHLKHATTAEEIALFQSAFNKLCRAFATLFDTLKRNRMDDEQAENISANEGGQTVGSVKQVRRKNLARKAPDSSTTLIGAEERAAILNGEAGHARVLSEGGSDSPPEPNDRPLPTQY